MKLLIVTGIALAALTGSAANAQTSGSDYIPSNAQRPLTESNASDSPSAPDVALGGEEQDLQPGMVVTDRAGAKVAVISQVDQIDDGRPAVLLIVNGAKFPVLASQLTLSPTGDEAITTLTSSEIRTLEINAD
jgi:hypothetical protein